MPPLKAWLSIDPKSHFSIHNIPFGVITHSRTENHPHIAVAIGDYALDLQLFTQDNGFAALSTIQLHQHVFMETTLNAFAALGQPIHRVVREYLQSVFLENGPFPDVLQNNSALQQKALIPLSECRPHMPMRIGDYTDFYAGLNHAFNVGVMFRGPQNALQPNYTHLPVGYHGRASSVVVSGTPIRRPTGQILLDPTAEKKEPKLSPCRKLDFELELGCFVCKPSSMGEPVPIDAAPEHLFGVVLMNDWSARDIQAWEYVPLGPFNSKNFGTTISPWVVLVDALEPFSSAGLSNQTTLLPYLDESGRKSHYSIDLSVSITPAGSEKAPSVVARTSATNLLFSFPQMLAHHTVGGCPFNVGDLMGSGTISGTEANARGSLLEISENGKVDVELRNGVTRKFLEDGDVVVFSGVCGGADGALVGFGECIGKIEPALNFNL